MPLDPPLPLFSLSSPALRRRRARLGGFTLLEAIASMVITVLISASVIATLLNTQSNAARARLMTNARVIVQRNIDTALGVPFTGVGVPAILGKTTNGSVVFSEDGGSEATPVAITGEGDTVVEGTLYRTVVDLDDDEKPTDVSGAVIRRITFRIEYTYLGRDYEFEMSTIRAQDNQLM